MGVKTALDYLRSRDEINPNSIFVFGQSLGGAVAVATAAKNSSLAGVIVEVRRTISLQRKRSYLTTMPQNSFTNISELVDKLFPYVAPLKSCLLRLKWDSLDRVGRIESPVLFLAGLRVSSLFFGGFVFCCVR